MISMYYPLYQRLLSRLPQTSRYIIIHTKTFEIVNKYIGSKATFVLSTSLVEQGLLILTTVMKPFSASVGCFLYVSFIKYVTYLDRYYMIDLDFILLYKVHTYIM